MLPSSSMEKAVLATIAYADIFDYPLTFTEVHQFLIGQKATVADLQKNIERLSKSKKIEVKEGFYFLSGRAEIVAKRTSKSKYYQQKIKLAQKSAKLLQFLPLIKVVGLSGGLAVGNANSGDDIDFFIIAAAGQIWTTRLLSTVVLTIFGRRRTPQSKNLTDKVCLNMFIDERQLEVRPHDLYLAHEVLQLKPLFDRGGSYQKFITANSWAYQFLPNWPKVKKTPTTDKLTKLSRLSFYFENIIKNFQLGYMAKRRTIEKITPTKLQFHPKDVHRQVLQTYFRKLKDLKIT